MSRVHDVLRWANRREVAREVTARGYRVSGETLNRWVRDEQEFPAIVERIVFELFTISGHSETAPPWAERLQQTVDSIHERQDIIMARQGQMADSATQKVIEALADPERLAWAERIAAAIRDESQRQSAEVSDGPPGTGAPGGAGPLRPTLGSSLARDSEE